MLLWNRKSFLHRIVIGNEKGIYFENPKCKTSWLSPGETSTLNGMAISFWKKTMFSIWWDQKETVYYELLKPEETDNWDRRGQQVINFNIYCPNNEQNRTKCTNDWYCSKTTFRSVTIPSFWTPPKRRNRICYDTCHICQTWLLPLITCFDLWRIVYLEYTLLISKTWEIDWINGFCLRTCRFTIAYSCILREMTKLCNLQRTILSIKHFSYFI